MEAFSSRVVALVLLGSLLPPGLSQAASPGAGARARTGLRAPEELALAAFGWERLPGWIITDVTFGIRDGSLVFARYTTIPPGHAPRLHDRTAEVDEVIYDTLALPSPVRMLVGDHDHVVVDAFTFGIDDAGSAYLDFVSGVDSAGRPFAERYKDPGSLLKSADGSTCGTPVVAGTCNSSGCGSGTCTADLAAQDPCACQGGAGGFCTDGTAKIICSSPPFSCNPDEVCLFSGELRSCVCLGAPTGLPGGGLPGSGSNDMPLNNGGDRIYMYSNPSAGGSGSPLPTGDLYWKVYAGDRVLRHQNGPLPGFLTMEIDGYYEALYDTDWTTSPAFYIRAHGPAVYSATTPGNLVPSFFQIGLGAEVVVQVGPSGFGNPCSIAPSLCSPGGLCPPPGFLNGYLVDLSFGTAVGSGIVVRADGGPSSDLATTYFVTGGMVATGGTCGFGDYDLQDVHSTDETIADDAGGISLYSGFQLNGSGPIADPVGSIPEFAITFREAILNVVADSGGALGVETSDNGGGAMNGLKLPVASGSATLGVEVRHFQGIFSFAAAGASLSQLPSGVPSLGAYLLVVPDPLFGSTLSFWNGPVVPATFEFTGEGVLANTNQLPVPPTAAGADLNLQGIVLNPFTGSGVNTNVVRTTLVP